MTNINKNQHTESSTSLDNSSKDSLNNTEKKCCFRNLKNCVQSFSPSKPFIALSCLLLGVLTTLVVENFTQSRRHYSFYHDAFADDFLNNDAFFRDIKSLKKEIDEDFAKHQKSFYDEFSQAEKSSTANKSNVKTGEDANYYYYELAFSGFKKEEIIVIVKDNAVVFSGENKTEDSNKDKASKASSSFHYSFAAPQYDTKQNPEIIRKDNSILLKLHKKK